MNAHELRQTFLRFFEERGHRVIPSAPLVPPGDPTLLFTSAGMVQFKPYFMGQADPPASRMASVQKCFRTTDIESVGDEQHLTFFEMLGNFSVGDYFKAEIIPWAHEFLTETLGLDKERLWPAVYKDDDEAFALWEGLGYPAEPAKPGGRRIMRYGEEENYWFSGDVGPCGPDSEIHYDFGEEFGCGPECHPSHECPRFIEIWNLVFMTYYCDGEKREPLPKKNIDTGSGFERVNNVLLFESPAWDKSKLPSVYDTQLFRPVITKIEELSGKTYGETSETDRAMRIVAEHTRAVTFLIGDERTPVVPSNEERGYVCRRMLRRAVYFGRRALGIEGPFLGELADVVIEEMKASYPELERQRKFVQDIIGPEERRFIERIDAGMTSISDLIAGRANVAAELNDWKQEVEPILQSSELEMWPTSLIGPAHNMQNSIRETWMVIGSGPSIPRAPSFLTHHAAGLLNDRLQTIFEHIEKMDGVIEETMIETKHGLGHEPTVKLVRQRLSEIARELRTAIVELEREETNMRTTILGQEAFVLHDTFGFPIELTREIAAEHGFTVDEAGFEEEMEEQKERARAATASKLETFAPTVWVTRTDLESEFVGYTTLNSTGKVTALQQTGVGGQEREVSSGVDSEVYIILERTPFYPEGGGQVGDRGEIAGPNGRIAVEDTQRVAEKLIVHRGRVTEGRVAVGDEVTATVDPVNRANTRRNHTATHLLHAALRKVIGSHVRQAGSLVAPDYLRFDFTHTEAVTPEQLREVEALVNEKVRQDIPVHSRETSFDEAMQEGVLAFFGDKYGERVRVVEVNTVVPRFSAELCGGTHCERTGEIGLILVTGESSIGSGMRRIEALTGVAAEEHVRKQEEAVAEIARRLGTQKQNIMQKIESLVEEGDAQRKRIEKLERSLASGSADGNLMDGAKDVEGVSVIAKRVDAPSVDSLRYMADSLRKSLKSGVAVLGSVIDERPMFIALVTKDLNEKGVHAGNLLKQVATVAGGGGGGRPDMAQGGGKDASKTDQALGIVEGAVREMLGGSGG